MFEKCHAVVNPIPFYKVGWILYRGSPNINKIGLMYGVPRTESAMQRSLGIGVVLKIMSPPH